MPQVSQFLQTEVKDIKFVYLRIMFFLDRKNSSYEVGRIEHILVYLKVTME